MLTGVLALLSSVLILCQASTAQIAKNSGRNNPYSPSPSQRKKSELPAPEPKVTRPNPNEAAFLMQPSVKVESDNQPHIVQRTITIPSRTHRPAPPPTQFYKVGVGDVLFINLKNAAHGSGYHTVRRDGTIDFPLAGEDLLVAGHTTDEIDAILASRITLYRDPQLEVKVREFGSHKITVSGLVENPGDKHLQREAIPLYVIRAEAVADPKATKVLITRAPLLKPETHELAESSTDNVLIYPGNSVEFTASANSVNGVYFISGEVASPGQKELINGLRLYQAVASSGGAKGSPKKAVLRRKNENGMFITFSHDLRAIREGKAADPALVAGDVIEIKN